MIAPCFPDSKLFVMDSFSVRLFSETTGYLLNTAGGLIRTATNDRLGRYGLTTAHLQLLEILRAGGPINQSNLGSRASVDRTTMVALVDQLEAARLVERRKDTNDRRQNLIHLTGSGRNLLKELWKLARAAQQEFLKPLNRTESDQLHRILTKLIVAHADQNE